jgi:hypothetical protein
MPAAWDLRYNACFSMSVSIFWMFSSGPGDLRGSQLIGSVVWRTKSSRSPEHEASVASRRRGILWEQCCNAGSR